MKNNVQRHKRFFTAVAEFTLIELMVVIAIIAILASMFLPGLQKAKSLAQSSKCANNLKGITLATHQYISDYNDFFPPYVQSASWIWNWAWGLKDGYISTTATFRCPNSNVLSNENTNGNLDIVHIPNSAGAYYNIAYGYNYIYLGYNITTPYPTFKLSNVKNHSSKILFADSYNATSNLLTNSNYAIIAPNMSDYGAIHDRHNSGANIVWIDGHVSWIKLARLNLQSGTSIKIQKYFNPAVNQ